MAARMMAAAGCEHVNDTLHVRVVEEIFSEKTALMESSTNGRTEVVELLIGAKADVNKCNQVNF